MIRPLTTSVFIVLFLSLIPLSCKKSEEPGGVNETYHTYRHFDVEEVKDNIEFVETNKRIVNIIPKPDEPPPLWADNVSQAEANWSHGPSMDEPYFKKPVPFVRPPLKDSSEPFYRHNHQPDITWLPNGDLMAIWYSTETGEREPELTVLTSRLRDGSDKWDPSSEFFKAEKRNMHGSAIFHDENGKIYHINGMGGAGDQGWRYLAMLMRTSVDNGVTWTRARPISSGERYLNRHQVIGSTTMTKDGTLIQPADVYTTRGGPTAIHISKDDGNTWTDPGGKILGVHAGVVELKDGRLMALGRTQEIDGKMPLSISDDMGKTWSYSASPFPRIASGQRLALTRLREGPIMLVSFTCYNRHDPFEKSMTFVDKNGNEFEGYGMYAALSYDEGETWPVKKLITPGEGEYDGGGHTHDFTATPTIAEHAGYLSVTQTPDNVIHLISSRLHYQFNLAWVEKPNIIPE